MFDFDIFWGGSKRSRKYIPKDYKYKVLDKQKWRCARCKADLRSTRWHIDHKKPVALGGKTIPSNLQALCPTCHNKKTAEDRRKISQAKSKKPKNSFEDNILAGELELEFLGISKRNKKKKRKNKDWFDFW